MSLPSGPGPAFPEENTAPALRKPIRGATDSNSRPRQSAVWGSPIRVHPITMPSQGQHLALRPWGPAQPSSCSNPLFLAPGAPWDPPPAPVVRGPEGALVLRSRDQASTACLKRLKAQYKHCQHEMNFAAESFEFNFRGKETYAEFRSLMAGEGANCWHHAPRPSDGRLWFRRLQLGG